jgi:hypothetical protein
MLRVDPKWLPQGKTGAEYQDAVEVKNPEA